MRILLPEGCYHYDVVVNIEKMPILQIPEDVVNMKIICTVLMKERLSQLPYPTLESAAHNECQCHALMMGNRTKNNNQ